MTNAEFDISGINHLAPVCSDMERTVDFCANVLGMPLVKTLELPDGRGQHFFFDLGGANHPAFSWFPDAPPAAPGIASAVTIPGTGEIASAVGSTNHVAFTIPADKFAAYTRELTSADVRHRPAKSAEPAAI
ncbi:VOC family protein [Rhodococcus sp. AG1013]|uniref:VOC family protein n=1 Tax=unclassified Rhodococcus (in: high G+C Gram-positive bacteria) TaxID=192944 RepID=UPI000E2BF4EC|nr:catechol 2,3-dioxygenase-like lactoylglutathione lyase family enzyme [Rhodococcus sp. AG1013]